jgi:hypothetical protein
MYSPYTRRYIYIYVTLSAYSTSSTYYYYYYYYYYTHTHTHTHQTLTHTHTPQIRAKLRSAPHMRGNLNLCQPKPLPGGGTVDDGPRRVRRVASEAGKVRRVVEAVSPAQSADDEEEVGWEREEAAGGWERGEPKP